MTFRDLSSRMICGGRFYPYHRNPSWRSLQKVQSILQIKNILTDIFSLIFFLTALATETELKKFGQLLEDYGGKLLDDRLDVSHHVDFNFVQLSSKPAETVSLSYLTRSENAMLAKVVMALSAIGEEADFCSTEAREQFYDPFLYYGEGLGDFVDEAETMKCIARMLPTIQKAACFVDHCTEVVLNTVHQLSSLRDRQATVGAASFAASPDVHLHVVYENLAKLLSALVVVDGVILQHGNLRGHWATYRRYIKAAIMDPAKYNVDVEDMTRLEKLLVPAETKVIDGNMFKVQVNLNYF